MSRGISVDVIRRPEQLVLDSEEESLGDEADLVNYGEWLVHRHPFGTIIIPSFTLPLLAQTSIST